VSVESVLFATIMRIVEHRTGKFPVFSLVIREFDHGDWFASDCTIRQRVLLRLQFIEKSSKYAPVRPISYGLWPRRMLRSVDSGDLRLVLSAEIGFGATRRMRPD
jgi:hypothetical protein